MPEERKRKKQTDIEFIGRELIKFIVVTCLPWILISKLDKLLDYKSEESFDWWGFCWSFPATHLSWLVLTVVFGLPLWGLLGAPIVLLVCVIRGVAHLSLFTGVIGAIIVAGIWIASYHTVKKYRSERDIRKVRDEIYREGDLNEA